MKTILKCFGASCVCGLAESRLRRGDVSGALPNYATAAHAGAGVVDPASRCASVQRDPIAIAKAQAGLLGVRYSELFLELRRKLAGGCSRDVRSAIIDSLAEIWACLSCSQRDAAAVLVAQHRGAVS